MKNSDTKHSHGNVSETDNKNSNLIEYEAIDGTPFTVISVEDEVTTEKRHFGTIGKGRITEMYKTKEEAINVTKEITWDRIVQVLTVIIEEKDKIKEMLNERGNNNGA